MTNFYDSPHQRYNALTGEWVLVSPHRTKRPWQGQQEKKNLETRPKYDPTCYLCPGNSRVGGTVQNPYYEDIFVFRNDFSALLPEVAEEEVHPRDFIHGKTVAGECRVICFSPRHDLTLAEMSLAEIDTVVDLWMNQEAELAPHYQWVQIFENRGAVMGSSNPHPHGQIWASNFLPNEATKEVKTQSEYFSKHQTPLLLDVMQFESEAKERVVAENEEWLAIVPYWAVWPFELLVLPKTHITHLFELDMSMRKSLSVLMKDYLVRYDNLFETSFPYSMGWHPAPNDGEAHPEWLLHAHYYPPLLRSASVKKFMVGYEMLAQAQRDITAEQAAARLRELSAIHYRDAIE